MSDSDTSSEGSISGVELGYLRDIKESWKMQRCYFPSKVGGKPAWLNPKQLPNAADLACGLCGRQCVFLLQLYAPDAGACEEAFHRAIFVFCCKNPVCYKTCSNQTFKVFRCQLPRENPFYPKDPPDYSDPKFFTTCEQYDNLCVVCGCLGSKSCSSCSSVRYCSKHHQTSDWNRHKLVCKTEKVDDCVSNEKNCLLFPTKEIIIDEEYISTSKARSRTPAKPLSGNPEINVSGAELEQFSNSGDSDKAFTSFRKKISENPEQIIRYDKGGDPLWCSSENAVSLDSVPKCKCGAKRQYEFEIMPQLLCYLDIPTEVAGPSIDWGVLAIYTCLDNCIVEDNGYSQEYLHKQDPSSQGQGIKL